MSGNAGLSYRRALQSEGTPAVASDQDWQF